MSNHLWGVFGFQERTGILSSADKYQLYASHWSTHTIDNTKRSSSMQLNEKPLAVVVIGAIPTYTDLTIIGGVFRRIPLKSTDRSGLPEFGVSGRRKSTQQAHTHCRTIDHSSITPGNTLQAENVPTLSIYKIHWNPELVQRTSTGLSQTLTSTKPCLTENNKQNKQICTPEMVIRLCRFSPSRTVYPQNTSMVVTAEAESTSCFTKTNSKKQICIGFRDEWDCNRED